MSSFQFLLVHYPLCLFHRPIHSSFSLYTIFSLVIMEETQSFFFFFTFFHFFFLSFSLMRGSEDVCYSSHLVFCVFLQFGWITLFHSGRYNAENRAEAFQVYIIQLSVAKRSYTTFSGEEKSCRGRIGIEMGSKDIFIYLFIIIFLKCLY